ncbi:hypothetical protein CLM62_12785 [Streptomyces sp. SA15]|uniref:hypothetical protein n=1 Tax=Streptomyces sp. SA15 TaxID=934019 RepID=UPI000BB09AE3|nr:hypothetical protein [Streptomyces sp. SA15]PAZ15666.1 hypothetical protein CLM62_12785 [Streptomyces sp. SA15]
MAVPARAVPFILRLADGRTWGGAEFPGGFLCLHHPDELNVCTIAVSLGALLVDQQPGDPLHGAEVIEREWW